MRLRHAMLAGVAVISVAGTGSANADRDVQNGPIAFASTQTGRFEIYRMRADGTHVRQLTHTAPGKDTIFSDWSPDGRLIAFDRGAGNDVKIFVTNRNGGDVRHVTRQAGFNGDPSFSPDGRRLVFEHSPAMGCCSNIFSIRLDGSGLRKVTHFTRETFASEPEYSPDGRWIAFMKFPPAGRRSAIFVMRVDGHDLHRVTRQPLDAGHPSWSPDGGRIVFNDKLTEQIGDIFTIRPGGGGLHRLTFVEGRGQADFRPDYSPDGTRIVFNHSAGPSSAPEVWVMLADGSHKHRIANGLVDGFAPRWGPRTG